MYQKKYEEPELRDDFIFGKVMRNKAICKKTPEILLGIPIEEIDYPETQKAINERSSWLSSASTRICILPSNNLHFTPF